jgi:hypothetical protein
MNRTMAALAFSALLGFLGILVVEVPYPDLIAVAVLVLVLVAYDMITSSGRRD